MKRPEITLAWTAASLLLSPATVLAETTIIRADIWADNWYAMYIGEMLVKEDSTPYNTERSFNSDTVEFEVELPAQLNVVMKDFKETDSGLEYIGRHGQQIGDGGFAAQLFDADSGELLAHSNSDWQCLVVHRAPLNRSCVSSSNPATDCEYERFDEPDGWKDPVFDDAAWPNAVEHSADAVRPRGGYPSIDWHPDVRLIWGEDLEIDNTVLCRTTIKEIK